MRLLIAAWLVRLCLSQCHIVVLCPHGSYQQVGGFSPLLIASCFSAKLFVLGVLLPPLGMVRVPMAERPREVSCLMPLWCGCLVLLPWIPPYVPFIGSYVWDLYTTLHK